MKDSEAINCCNQIEHLAVNFEKISHNERRTLFVIVLAAIMMVIEISAGYFTGSMALLADGYHMASHVGALGITYAVYQLARMESLKRHFSFGTGKFLPLGGYTSAIGLGLVSVWMAVESVHRFFYPITIKFNEAIVIAIAGLGVNLISVWILRDQHDDSEQDHVHDHNHKSAVLHVLSDALTSVAAIIALVIGKFHSAVWLDSFIGITASLVILRWAYGLCKETAWELLDGHAKNVSIGKIKNRLEKIGVKVVDLHLWKVGPGNFVCQLILETKKQKGSDYFREELRSFLGSTHLIIEERILS